MVWVIPVAAMAMSLGIVVFALFFRQGRQKMYHRERMAALEKNLPLPESFWQPATPSSSAYLLRGLIWIAVGVGLSIFFAGLYFSEEARDREVLGLVAVGVLPTLVGVAYLIVRRVEGGKGKESRATQA